MNQTANYELPDHATNAPALASDVVCTILFRRGDSHQLSQINSQGPVPEWAVARIHDLAAASIANGVAKSCVLTSPVACMIAAEPIPSHPNEGVTVLFKCDFSQTPAEAAQDKLASVKEYARTIALDRPPEPTSPFEAAPSAPALAWNELGRQLRIKLLQEVAARWKKKRSVALALLVVVAVGGVPIPYRVKCKAVCEPVVSRFVAAPFDARLASSTAQVGNRVAKGDMLATLETGELQSELANLRDQAAQTQQKLLAALASGDHSAAEHERLESDQLAREINLLEERQQKLCIKAPIDGIVVAGDLERSQGAPLSVGDNLFEIASLDQVVVEVAVPEREIGRVDHSMRVTIHLDAGSGNAISSSIDRIHLRNELLDHESVYIAEALIDNSGGAVRPGMSGTAAIHAGYKTVGWVFFHRPFESLRRWTGW